MNKKEVELTKYFDNMCIIFNTKKVMFSEWEKYFKKLKETITSGNIDSIKSETESLQKAMYEVSAKLYQNAQAAQQAAPNAATGAESQTNDSANGNVYDADFKDVDNK